VTSRFLGDFDRRTGRAIALLGATQVFGWGTTYYLPTVLVRPLSADLGLSPELVFAGITIQLLVSGAVAPLSGRHIARRGAGGALTLGSGLTAAGLAILSMASGLAGYVLGWIVLGIAMPLTLQVATAAALARIAGPDARRALTTMTLITGFTSSVFWPLTAWLETKLGWRGTTLLFALFHLTICLPIHLWLLPPPAPSAGEGGTAGGSQIARPALPAELQPRAFRLAAVGFAGMGFVSWGMSLHLIEILLQIGLASAAALWVATLTGPAQVAARAFDIVLAGRFSAVGNGVAAGALLAASSLLIFAAGPVLLVTVPATIAWGAANGLITVARLAAPLELFGSERYAIFMSRLMLPLNTAFAAAPVAFAAALTHLGAAGAIAIAVALGAISAMAMWMLLSLAEPHWRTPQQAPPP
jgi:predicted MFS family arabinose efflux permease